MNSVFVKIPKGSAGLTLYAEGLLLGKEDKKTYYELELSKNKVIILYYKFHFNHRRLYIVCAPELMDNCFVKSFSLVSDNMSVIAELHGRGFDRFKRTMEYLVKASDSAVLDLPPVFFFQLAYLCRNEKNDRVNLKKLSSNYNLELKEVEWK